MSENSIRATYWKLFESSGCIAFYLMYKNLLEQAQDADQQEENWN